VLPGPRRRGDRVNGFAALHESAIGTQRKCRSLSVMSAPE
jgi:hypothetical protein